MQPPHTIRNYLTEDERARIVEEEHLRFHVRYREFRRILLLWIVRVLVACVLAIVGFALFMWYTRAGQVPSIHLRW